MAARGFIELLRLADRGRQKQLGGTEAQINRWSGIAFTMSGFNFIAPLGEVAEVIPVPAYSGVPNARQWMRGLANVRGQLLPLTDLPSFLQLPAKEVVRQNQSKVIIVDHAAHYCGLMVDQVLGIQHFNKQSYFSTTVDLPANLVPYVSGRFEQQGKSWNVFLFSQLVKDQRFLSASE